MSEFKETKFTDLNSIPGLFDTPDMFRDAIDSAKADLRLGLVNVDGEPFTKNDVLLYEPSDEEIKIMIEYSLLHGREIYCNMCQLASRKDCHKIAIGVHRKEILDVIDTNNILEALSKIIATKLALSLMEHEGANFD